MTRRFMITTFMAMMLFVPNLSTAGDIIFISNENVAESTLSRQDIKNIFLGRKTVWGDKTKIVFVVQEKSEVHDQFLKEYINKSASQFANFWKKQVFTGKGTPPKSFDSEQELVQFVAQTPGAIGYVSSGASLDNVEMIIVQ